MIRTVKGLFRRRRADSLADYGAVSGAIHAIAALARAHGLKIDPNEILARHSLTDDVIELSDLAQVARRAGLKLRLSTETTDDEFAKATTPFAAVLDNKECVVVITSGDAGLRYIDTLTGAITRSPFADFRSRWSGLAFSVGDGRTDPQSVRVGKVDDWIIENALRFRGSIAAIMAFSVILQLTGLSTPLLFQVIIDKVLVHQSQSTLIVVTIGLCLIACIEATIQWMRSYALASTSAKIDARLGSQLFAHLMTLPTTYFDTRPAGQTVARVRELETVRSFLTSQGAAAVIDSAFALIYVGVLAIYSLKLLAIIAITLPCFFIFATIIRFPIKRLVQRKFYRGAHMQQHMIESILGAHTIKALGVERETHRIWEARLVDYVRSATALASVAGVGNAGIQLISKLSNATIILVGSLLVIKGEMTVGSLVAFNMIANQLMAPMVRLSGAWQDLQQVQISMNRVGDILEAEPERQPEQSIVAGQLKGAVQLSCVVFRYAPNGPEILKGVSLDIAPGQIVGVIGPSGSGKSTLARIILRMNELEAGRIFLDGIDIAQAPTEWFRRQIGIVLQETYLLNRSIHENIALGRPNILRDEVVRFAKLSGADEFISQLPRGYDTVITERGTNLSGGQRQRIAIARALAIEPRILLFDEATSALDYESEQAIQQNMDEICRGRTVIIIAHRLAALRHCTRIIGIKAGRIVEDGFPRELASDPTSLFGQMVELQRFQTIAMD